MKGQAISAALSPAPGTPFGRNGAGTLAPAVAPQCHWHRGVARRASARCHRSQRRREIDAPFGFRSQIGAQDKAQNPLSHHRADVGPTRHRAAPRPSAAASPACWTPSTGLRTSLRGGTGSQSDPDPSTLLRARLILRLGSGPARTSALRERRDALRGHTAPAVCAGVHRAEINRQFDAIVAFAETLS
jgi:hypothetical protein